MWFHGYFRGVIRGSVDMGPQWGPITSNPMFKKLEAKSMNETSEIIHVLKWQIPMKELFFLKIFFVLQNLEIMKLRDENCPK